jgi:hypothetical protein
MNKNPSREEIEAMLRAIDEESKNEPQPAASNEIPVIPNRPINVQNIEEEAQEPLKASNPTQEDIIKQKKKKPTVAAVIVDENENFEMRDGVLIRKKKSRFEPDPIKCKLPSSGIGYRGRGVTQDGYIYIRRMSSDELLKLGAIDSVNSFNKIINELLEKCILSEVEISSIPIIDKIPLFIFMVGASLDKKINLKDYVECSAKDSDSINFLIGINELNSKVKQLDKKTFKYPFEIKLNSFPNVTIKYIAPRVSEEGFFAENTDVTEDTVSRLYEQLVVEISGDVDSKSVSMNDIEEIMRWMSLEDKKRMRNAIDEMNKYGIDLEYKYSQYCSKGEKCCKAKETYELKVQDLILEIVKTIAES